MATKNLLAAAALIAMGVTAVGTAHADALAQSTLTVSNFRIFSGATVLDLSQLSNVTITDSTTLSANLNGNNSGGPGIPVSFGGVGLPSQTVCAPTGGCPSPFTAATIPAGGTGSTAGSSLQGAPITGLPVPVPAEAITGALTQVLGFGSGTAQSGLTLSSLLQFTATQQINNLSMSFDATLILNAWAQMTAGFNSATAGSALSFVLVNQDTGVTVFEWKPGDSVTGGTITNNGGLCDINRTITSNSPPGGLNTGSCSGSFAASVTGPLTAGTNYSFGITQQSNSTVISTTVPEPSALALAGLALTAVGLAGRRRKANKAK